MNNDLGEYVRRRRLDMGLSLREFAKLCDISHTHVDSIEKGYDFRTNKKVNVTNETISKLSRALNTPASTLFNMSLGEKMPPEKTLDEQLEGVEFALLDGARGLTDEGKKAVLTYIKFLEQQEKEGK